MTSGDDQRPGILRIYRTAHCGHLCLMATFKDGFCYMHTQDHLEQAWIMNEVHRLGIPATHGFLSWEGTAGSNE